MHTLKLEGKLNFIYDNINILEEFDESCDFLVSSELASIFDFTINDPFLLSISKKLTNLRKSYSNSFGKSAKTDREGYSKCYIFLPKNLIELIKLLKLDLSKRKKINLIAFKQNSKPGQFLVIPKGKKKLKIIKNNICSKKLLNHVYEILNNEFIEANITKIITSCMNQQFTKNISLKIIANTINSEIKDIAITEMHNAQEEIEEEKMKKLQDSLLPDMFYKDFIDFEIKKIKIGRFSEKLLNIMAIEHKIELENQRKHENIALTDEFYEYIINYFIDEFKDITEIIEQVLIEEIKETEEILAISEMLNNELIENELNSLNYLEICEDIYNEELYYLDKDKQDHISSENSKKLQISLLIENIVRNLIEYEINLIDINHLCESIFLTEIALREKNPKENKGRLTRIANEYNFHKLLEMLFNDLFEELIGSE